MSDAPSPWGTGPFTRVEGDSTLDTEQVVIEQEPFAATYLCHEDRTPRVHLQANLLFFKPYPRVPDSYGLRRVVHKAPPTSHRDAGM
jgi:hypothetical protein